MVVSALRAIWVSWQVGRPRLPRPGLPLRPDDAVLQPGADRDPRIPVYLAGALPHRAGHPRPPRRSTSSRWAAPSRRSGPHPRALPRPYDRAQIYPSF